MYTESVPAACLYNVYDQFAWCYRKGWGEDYHLQARPVLEQHIFPRLGPRARVLDLCCGSGDLSAALAARGYLVTGLDGSAEMLAYARERVPDAEFLLADARSFHFELPFDAVLSTFDSLNHVVEIEELAGVFRNVHGVLAPGGFFAFDLNMRDAFEALWRGSTSSVAGDEVSITRGSYDRSRKIGRADVTVFRPEAGGLWRRFDAAVMERCYSEDEVTGALKRSGFACVAVYEAGELGMRGDIGFGRNFFFADRP